MYPDQLNESFYASDESIVLQHNFSSLGSMLIFSFIFLLGIPGNGLVIWVLALKMKQTVNTIWFLHLAVADFVFCLSLPFYVMQLALHGRWPLGWFLCKIIPAAIIFNMFASVFFLTAISIDRYLLVTKPVWCQNHRRVRFVSLLCVGIWLLAFIMCCPAFIYRETSVDELGNIKCIYNWDKDDGADKGLDGLFNNESSFQLPPLTADGIHEGTFPNGAPDTDHEVSSSSLPSSPLTFITQATAILLESHRPRLNATNSSDLHSNIPAILSDFLLPDSYSNNFFASNDSLEMYFYDYDQPPKVLVSITLTRCIFGFVLPFGIMAACYSLIAHKMLNGQFAKSRRKALRLILLVVITFFLCWAPYHVIGVLYVLADPGTAFHEQLAPWDHASIALAYANSCINPLIYVCVGHNFREKACPKIQGILEKAFSEEGTRSTAYSQDRTKSTGNKDGDSSVL